MTDAEFIELNRLLHLMPNCTVGGPLHIVTDDLNVRDSDLDFCELELQGHWSLDDLLDEDVRLIQQTGAAIIAALRAVDEPERERLLELDWGYRRG